MALKVLTAKTARAGRQFYMIAAVLLILPFLSSKVAAELQVRQFYGVEVYVHTPTGVAQDVLIIIHDNPDNGEGVHEAAIDAAEGWIQFADEHGLYIFAPVFDEENFSPGSLNALFSSRAEIEYIDQFLIQSTIDLYRELGIEDPAGSMVYGFGLGGAMAARYALIQHEFVRHAVVVAPDEYTYPRNEIRWPYGTRVFSLHFTNQRGERLVAALPRRFAGDSLLRAGLLSVIVGDEDTDDIQELPGHNGQNRRDIAVDWTASFNSYLFSRQSPPGFVSLLLVSGVGHDEDMLRPFAESVLANLIEQSETLHTRIQQTQ